MPTKKTDAQNPETSNVSEPEAPEQTEEPTPVVKDVPKQKLDAILRHHVYGAMGVGLIPFPIVDLVALTGVQLNLLRKLAKVYGVPFSKEPVKKLLSSLVGSSLSVAAAPSIAASVAKFVPLFGQTAGVIALPIVGGAATYAVGKVFIQHFESGGTFLSFNPKKMKAYYAKMFEEGKLIAKNLKREKEAQGSK